jgi:hypothetical protein
LSTSLGMIFFIVRPGAKGMPSTTNAVYSGWQDKLLPILQRCSSCKQLLLVPSSAYRKVAGYLGREASGRFVELQWEAA